MRDKAVRNFDQNARQASLFRAGKDSADGEAVPAFRRLVRSLLLLDILAKEFDGGAATTSSEIAVRPKSAAPEFFTDAPIILSAD